MEENNSYAGKRYAHRCTRDGRPEPAGVNLRETKGGAEKHHASSIRLPPASRLIKKGGTAKVQKMLAKY